MLCEYSSLLRTLYFSARFAENPCHLIPTNNRLPIKGLTRTFKKSSNNTEAKRCLTERGPASAEVHSSSIFSNHWLNCIFNYCNYSIILSRVSPPCRGERACVLKWPFGLCRREHNAPGRATHAGQTEGDGPDKARFSGPPEMEVSWPGQQPINCKNSYAQRTSKKPRILIEGSVTTNTRTRAKTTDNKNAPTTKERKKTTMEKEHN